MTHTPRRVLIAHQTAVPHYRVPFYSAVQRLRTPWWVFTVVHDADVERRAQVFSEPVDPRAFDFNTLPTRTFSCRLSGKRVLFQTFVFRVSSYDLVILEDAFNNLVYPLARWVRGRRTAIAHWGHGRDRSVVAPRGWKCLAAALKLRRSRSAAGFFAYTHGVRNDLEEHGVNPEKVFVLENTIDIERERVAFERLSGQRAALRSASGLRDARVLLHMGRLDRRMRIGFLMNTVQLIERRDASHHLLVVGAGSAEWPQALDNTLGTTGYTYYGPIVDTEQLARIYIQSDAYVFPGDVGLGPLHALCYDLTPVVIDAPTHALEFEYLSCQNVVVVAQGAMPEQYANAIHRLWTDRGQWRRLRDAAWPSISHLTIEKMAKNFVAQVDQISRDAPG